MNDLEQEEQLEQVISKYSEGKSLESISSKLGLALEEVQSFLTQFKNDNRKNKNSYMNDIKEVVAMRVDSGVAVAEISRELQLNKMTVKRFHLKFGEVNRKQPLEEHMFTRIDGEHWREICPSCGSKNNNQVNEESTYCMDCGIEHTYCVEYLSPDGKKFIVYSEAVEHCGAEQVRSTCYVLKLNYEYMEE